MLTIENVHKAFVSKRGGAMAVLRKLDLVVEAGQALALVGPSGCGKSTLLRIIAGLDGEYDGAVRVNGARVAGPGADRGLVFQEHRLLPWLTLAENVAFGIEDWALAERDRRVRELITLVGLSGFEGAYPQQLSGGMAQRAALARALAPNPSTLLLDEPFAALDAFTKTQLQEELLRLRAVSGATLILVTHDIEEAVYLADRVVVLSERPGRVQSVIDVALAHPRDRVSAEFVEVRRDVHRELFETLRASRPNLHPGRAHDRITLADPLDAADFAARLRIQ
jgi:sulfonate transport system ATP-binding protein